MGSAVPTMKQSIGWYIAEKINDWTFFVFLSEHKTFLFGLVHFSKGATAANSYLISLSILSFHFPYSVFFQVKERVRDRYTAKTTYGHKQFIFVLSYNIYIGRWHITS